MKKAIDYLQLLKTQKRIEAIYSDMTRDVKPRTVDIVGVCLDFNLVIIKHRTKPEAECSHWGIESCDITRDSQHDGFIVLDSDDLVREDLVDADSMLNFSTIYEVELI